MFNWGFLLWAVLLAYPQSDMQSLFVFISLLNLVLLANVWIPYEKGWLILTAGHVLPFLVLSETWLNAVLIFGLWGGLYYQGRIFQTLGWRFRLLKRDQAKLKRDIKLLKEQQASGDHLSNHFLASLSREIRTPMTNVLGMLRLLSETELNNDQRRMQNIATSAGENIILLVDELLDLSKIISGQLVLDSVVFNLRQSIDATINLLAPMAYSKNTELTHICDPDIPLRVRGDARRLSQVLSNIIGFVIDFTEGGEIAVNVHLTPLNVVEGVLRIHVSSKNTLMPENIQTEIHDLLESHDHLTHVSPHHLGVVIAKGVVDAMRGGIGFVMAGQHGLTFWITAQITLSTQQTFQSKTPDEFLNQRVLLIDMTKGLVSSLHNDLDSWQMEVDSVNGYQKALEMMRSAARNGKPYHVAILNMALEYVGSLKLSALMAGDPSLEGIHQMILCTVEQRGMVNTIKHESKVEQCLFLTKPFSRGNVFHGLLKLFGAYVTEKAMGHTPLEAHGKESDQDYQILLVEDNKVNQMVVVGLLNKFGYSSEVTARGTDALARMKEKSFDLILMDCNLPDIDGYRVSREYRQYEEQLRLQLKNAGQPIPDRTAIIALTANATEGEEARCFAAGMDDYLTKPIQADKMAIRLRTWLEQAPVESGVVYFQDAAKNTSNWSSSHREQ